jgi:hypothetical protein
MKKIEKRLKYFISGFVSSSDLFSFINKLAVYLLAKKILHGIKQFIKVRFCEFIGLDVSIEKI